MATISAHSYLGDLQDIVGEGCTPLLEPGTTYQIPMLPLEDTLVCPGSYLPLRLTDPRLRQIVTAAMQAPSPVSRLIALIMTNYREAPLHDGGAPYLGFFNTVACTVEIIKQSADGVCLLTQGRQRVEIDFENSPQPLDFQCISMRVLQDTLPAIPSLNQAAWPPFVYRQVNATALAKSIRTYIQQHITTITTNRHSRHSRHSTLLEEGVKEEEGVGEEELVNTICQDGGDPTQLSYWLLGNLPFNRSQKRLLFQTDIVVQRLAKELELIKEMQGIYCEQCNSMIAPLNNLVQVSKEGIGGHFVNSHGAVHEMLTVVDADVRIVSEPEVENSWFPGYAWQIAYCRRCTEHLGWYFTPIDQVHQRRTRNNTRRGRERARDRERELERGEGSSRSGNGLENDLENRLENGFYGLRSAALENMSHEDRNIERRPVIYELLGLVPDFRGLTTSEEEEEESGEEEEEEAGGDSE